MLYYKIIKGQYWLFGSKEKYLNGFMPRFKCNTKQQLNEHCLKNYGMKFN